MFSFLYERRLKGVERASITSNFGVKINRKINIVKTAKSFDSYFINKQKVIPTILNLKDYNNTTTSSSSSHDSSCK